MNAAAHVSLEVFRCVPLSCTQQPSSCAAKHKRSTAGARKGHYGTSSNEECPACRACVVGAAHARGERPEAWPDGRPIERSMKKVTLEPAWLGNKDSKSSSSAAPTRPRASGRAEGELGVDGAGPSGGGRAPNQRPLTAPLVGGPTASVEGHGTPEPSSHPEGARTTERDAAITCEPHASEGRGERALPTATREAQVGNGRAASSEAQTYEWEGRHLTVRQLATIAGTSRETFRQRLKRGWPMANAISGEVPVERSPEARAKRANITKAARRSLQEHTAGEAGPIEIAVAAIRAEKEQLLARLTSIEIALGSLEPLARKDRA